MSQLSTDAQDDDAATPLTPEEREQLIPTYITLRRELNEIEQIGIAEADRWAFSRRREVLDDGFLREVHRRMFKDVWHWAGKFRQTPRNIGVDSRTETGGMHVSPPIFWQFNSVASDSRGVSPIW